MFTVYGKGKIDRGGQVASDHIICSSVVDELVSSCQQETKMSQFEHHILTLSFFHMII